MGPSPAPEIRAKLSRLSQRLRPRGRRTQAARLPMAVQYKDICELESGARFHNVDLHIHSYGGSHDVNDSAMTPEAIVDSAVRQSLAVIAITDHNSNVNVERAIIYATENYGGYILVLPGVEVTTAHGHLLSLFRAGPDRRSQQISGPTRPRWRDGRREEHFGPRNRWRTPW